MPDLWKSSQPKARKAHRCEYCNRTILPGEVYSRSEGLWDGVFQTLKLCTECDVLSRRMVDYGFTSEGPDGEECYPYLPEVDYWDEVREISPELSNWVDAYFARGGLDPDERGRLGVES